jgi:hypothetical protein
MGPRSVALPAPFQTSEPPYPRPCGSQKLGCPGRRSASAVNWRDYARAPVFSLYVRFAPIATELTRCRELTRSAMCGRLRVGKAFLHVCRCSHVFGLLAAHKAAGHNALRGSGPGQKPAFDHALAHVGCPDRRIGRLCITCCSPSQPSHRARSRRDPGHAASATGSL